MFRRIIKNKKIVVVLLIMLVSLGSVVHGDDGKLRVYFFDIGQGDSSLIKVNGQNILIDGGPDNLVLKRLGESLSFFDRKIDLIILSHYHDDHVTGLIEILKRYQIGTVIYLKNSPSSLTFKSFLQTIKDFQIKYIVLDKTLNISLGTDCQLNLLAPQILLVPANNNNSIMAQLNCRQKRFLFSGDNEYRVENALLTSGLDLRAGVFKASHHGSKTSNREKFIRAVNPHQVIISVGQDNKFKHPSAEVIERLERLGIEIYRTDQLGTIEIIN